MPAEAPPAGTAGTDPLLILGGHRCGTSLVSGLLWQAGLHLGALLPAGPDNPRGFFESVDVLASCATIRRLPRKRCGAGSNSAVASQRCRTSTAGGAGITPSNTRSTVPPAVDARTGVNVPRWNPIAS